MPAPAVIPAPIAYINAAAVKKLVVGSRVQVARRLSLGKPAYCRDAQVGVNPLHQDLSSMNGGNGALQVAFSEVKAPTC